MTNKDDIYLTNLIKGLEATTSLVQNLLDDIKDNAILVGNLKVSVEHLNQQVSVLENIIRGNNSSTKSLLTRLALLEKEVADLTKMIEYHENLETAEQSVTRKRKFERLKVWAQAIIALICALIGALTAYYFK